MKWINFKTFFPANHDLEKIEDGYVCLIYTRSGDWFPRNINDVDDLKIDVESGYYTHWLKVKVPENF